MKIPQDKRERTYELTYLIAAEASETEVKSIEDQVAKLIKKHKGTVVATDDWGKKPLAYTVINHGKKHDEASYKFLKLSMETKQVAGLEKDLQMTQEIIRHLLVVDEGIEVEKQDDSAEQVADEVEETEEDKE